MRHFLLGCLLLATCTGCSTPATGGCSVGQEMAVVFVGSLMFATPEMNRVSRDAVKCAP
ncbi:hypothetical protein [Pseudomonas serbica]|jgi:hypothetical protein|uniref:hypothetical protein n=1 Tax=Pseudomonas serbica TaxID=2965074 RepID=UPI00237BF790|nr:hypothetical protein [Pseudomonas serbica]